VAGSTTGSAKQSRTTGAPKDDEAIHERHARGPLARNDAQAAISNSAHTGTWSDGFAHPRT